MWDHFVTKKVIVLVFCKHFRHRSNSIKRTFMKALAWALIASQFFLSFYDVMFQKKIFYRFSKKQNTWIYFYKNVSANFSHYQSLQRIFSVLDRVEQKKKKSHSLQWEMRNFTVESCHSSHSLAFLCMKLVTQTFFFATLFSVYISSY